MLFLQKLEGDADADELRQILAKPATEGLLYAHDKISQLRFALDSGPSEEDALLERLSHYSEPNIKVCVMHYKLSSIFGTFCFVQFIFGNDNETALMSFVKSPNRVQMTVFAANMCRL